MKEWLKGTWFLWTHKHEWFPVIRRGNYWVYECKYCTKTLRK